MISHDDNDFGKQRRNLVLVSAIIIAKDYLDIDYSDLEVITENIKIGNPDGLKVVLWILWVYFCIRYFTLFFEISNKGKDLRKEKKNNYLRDHYIKEYKKETGETNINYRVKKREKAIEVYVGSTRNKIREYKFSTVIDVLFILKSVIFYIFKTHYFFEYYFPIIFALLPLLTLIP